MKTVHVILLLCIFQLVSIAQDSFKPVACNSAIIEQLQTNGKKMQSLKAKFIQIKTISSLGVNVQMTGNFWYLAPGNVRWQYESPTSYNLVLADGVLHTDQIEQTSNPTGKQQAFEQLATVVQLLLGGQGFSSESYHQRCFSNPSQVMIELSPKQTDELQLVKSIQLIFNPNNLLIQQVKMTEASGDIIRIEFYELVANTSFAPTTFKVD